jgi:pyruvate formate lyase activating enzyme
MGCRAVAFTYNDPTVFLEYANDVADECHARGLATIAVTAGYICPKPREDFFAHIDAANVDLKGFSEDFYRHVCGAELEPVLETLEYLVHETNVWVELTTLLIPGKNDSTAELVAMTDWVVEHLGPEIPMHFSAFHPDYRMLDVPATPPETLTRARAIALDNGVRYAFTGNVHDADGGSSWCHACHGLLVARDWYELGEYHVTVDDDGGASCGHCGTPVAGRFETRPGEWGARRMAVQMQSRSEQQ